MKSQNTAVGVRSLEMNLPVWSGIISLVLLVFFFWQILSNIHADTVVYSLDWASLEDSSFIIGSNTHRTRNDIRWIWGGFTVTFYIKRIGFNTNSATLCPLASSTVSKNHRLSILRRLLKTTTACQCQFQMQRRFAQAEVQPRRAEGTSTPRHSKSDSSRSQNNYS